jgi:outer membrane protein assembly factor BamE
MLRYSVSPIIYRLLRTSLIVITVFLSACSVPNLQFPGVYKVPVQQGNIITQDMIDQLRPGMTRRQVIFVMGTPMVRDPFHQDRWDYVYNYQPGGGTRGQEMVTIYFEDDVLTQITGDFKPGQEAASEAGQPVSTNS